jgi:NADPH2:quinone reductase
MVKAVLCTAFGPPETLAVEDVPAERVGPGHVRIRTEAVALNFLDTLIIRGKYQERPSFPFSPGAEFAGTVVELGEDVRDLEVGQRIAGQVLHGACRDELVVPRGNVVPVADDIPSTVAAGILVACGTAMHALRQRARIQPGETLAVLGASGGAGLAAVQVGRLLGARVIACASSDEKLALAREHGAVECVNYSNEDLRSRLKALTDGHGVDVGYDPVGGSFAESLVRSMAWQGRYLVIGFASGIPCLPTNQVLIRGCDILGVFAGQFARRQPELHMQNIETIMGWIRSGQLSVHIGAEFSLEETGVALRLLESRQSKGKLVIRF